MTDDETIYCDACGEACTGAWECGFCSAILCPECAKEYEGACSLCIDALDEDCE